MSHPKKAAKEYSHDKVLEIIKNLQEFKKKERQSFFLKDIIAKAYDDLREAIDQHSYQAVVEHLSEQGVAITAGSLRQYMSQIRKAREAAEQERRSAAELAEQGTARSKSKSKRSRRTASTQAGESESIGAVSEVEPTDAEYAAIEPTDAEYAVPSEATPAETMEPVEMVEEDRATIVHRPDDGDPEVEDLAELPDYDDVDPDDGDPEAEDLGELPGYMETVDALTTIAEPTEAMDIEAIDLVEASYPMETTTAAVRATKAAAAKPVSTSVNSTRSAGEAANVETIQDS